MLKISIFTILLVSVSAGKSPNGEKYFSNLSEIEFRSIPKDVQDDCLLDTPGLISKYGYPVECHEIQTEDKYILTVHRIPGEKDCGANSNRIPVLLMHGLFGSSADWIINTPKYSLGYILADSGYDVWLGNARGNFYSRKHVVLNPDKSLFWKFSWHEIGFYDLPAMIDYILEKTGNRKLHYVGFSEGTTDFFVMGSIKPEYNEKIISMNAMGPAAYMANVKSALFTTLSKYVNTIDDMFKLFGINEVLPKSNYFQEVSSTYCNDESQFFKFCMDSMYGDNLNYINTTMVFLSHTPAGTSSRQLVHYAQLYDSKKFRQYDHGPNDNIKYYNNYEPPNYNLELVKAPVAVHYSVNDIYADVNDVEKLSNELGNLIGKYKIARTTFKHVDFTLAIDAKKQVYVNVMMVMKMYE